MSSSEGRAKGRQRDLYLVNLRASPRVETLLSPSVGRFRIHRDTIDKILLLLTTSTELEGVVPGLCEFLKQRNEIFYDMLWS